MILFSLVQPSLGTLLHTVQCVKFMDDATVQEAVNLTISLVPSNTSSAKILPKENTLIQTQLMHYSR